MNSLSDKKDGFQPEAKSKISLRISLALEAEKLENSFFTYVKTTQVLDVNKSQNLLEPLEFCSFFISPCCFKKAIVARRTVVLSILRLLRESPDTIEPSSEIRTLN